MEKEFINLTPENLDGEHLCCIIRSRKPHPGGGQAPLACRAAGGGACLPKAGREGGGICGVCPAGDRLGPRDGDNYLYLYCLWAAGAYKGKGYGRALMEYCLADAGAKGKSGVCMLGAQKQKAWLSDQSFAKKNTAFRWWTPPPEGMSCWPSPLTAPRPGSRMPPGGEDPGAGADHRLRHAVPLHSRQSGAGEALLRGEGRAGDPDPGGQPAEGQGVARRVQQLGGVLPGWLETVNLLDEAGLKRLLSK